MTSLGRMLKVLDLFRRGEPTFDVDAICSELGYAPATAYRYVRELCSAGLLARLPGGYALGPRVIELDRQMRDHDPVLNSSRDMIDGLVAQTGLNVLLSELYGDKVINVHQEAGMESEQLVFGRGRPFALFRSATARVILAYLPARQLRRIYEENRTDPDVLRLGADWRIFSKEMARIRKAGYCSTAGELISGRAGVAAPIFGESDRILGSITLVGNAHRVQAFNESFLAKLVRDAGKMISDRIAKAGRPMIGNAQPDETGDRNRAQGQGRTG